MKSFEVTFTDPAEPDNSKAAVVVTEQRIKVLFHESIVGLVLDPNFYSLHLVTTEPSALKISVRDSDKIEVPEEPVIKEPEVKEPVIVQLSVDTDAGFKGPESSDQLTFIHGLGSRIQELLNERGIKSFAQLANANESKIRSVLRDAGPRFKNQDPKQLITQAKLIKKQRWGELQAYWAELNEGREKPGPKSGSQNKK